MAGRAGRLRKNDTGRGPIRRQPARAKEAPSISWCLGAAFLLAYLLVPLIVVQFANGVDGDGSFVCRVKVDSRLGETLGGKLEFLLVDTLDGRSPAGKFVATLDHGYTAGIVTAGSSDIPETPAGSEFTLEGTLMDRDVFYGEQYLFFGYPQLYVSQVRTAFFWPSQIDRLEELYLAPFVSLVAVYWVWMLPFAEEYSLGSWLLVFARLVLVLAAVAAALIWRRTRQAWTPGVVWVAGAYVLLAIVLAIPSL